MGGKACSVCKRAGAAGMHRRVVGLGRPKGDVPEDPLDHLGLFDASDEPHGRRTPGADKGIDFVRLLDEASASSTERRAKARFAVEMETSLTSSMVAGSSPGTFRRFPRLTLLYHP